MNTKFNIFVAFLTLLLIASTLVAEDGSPLAVSLDFNKLTYHNNAWDKARTYSIVPKKDSKIINYDWCLTPTGNVVFIWQEKGLSNSNHDVFVQIFFDSESKSERIDVSKITGNQTKPKIVSLSDSSVVVAWQSDSAGPNNNNIWAQRISLDGKILWKTPALVCAYSGQQKNPQIALTVDDSAFIIWEDYRNKNADIYCQIIDASGSPEGPEDGVAIDSNPGEQKNAKFIFSSSNTIKAISWNDFSSNSKSPKTITLDFEQVPIPEPVGLFLLLPIGLYFLRRNR